MLTYCLPRMNDPLDNKSFERFYEPDALVNIMGEFTGIYRESSGVSVAEREARCEKVQWKAKVRPIRKDDLIAGRMVQAPIGFAGQTDGASLGYYLHEEAMEHPEKYANLIVRVGGFSERFVNLSPETQQEILSRTLY